jgi:hypothetical protein
MRFFRFLWWRFRYYLWHLNWRIMFRIAEWRTLHGIPVGVYGAWEEDLEREVFTKIEASLALVAEYVPHQLRRAARDLRRIWVRRAAYAVGYYVEYWGMCVLDLKFVADKQTSPAKLATVIVHEATHAHLFRCGIPYTETSRHRIETVCVAESAFFARRLPDGEELAKYVETCHPSDLNHWSNENLDRRMLEAQLEELQEASLPSWLKRYLRRVILSRAA